MYINTWVINEYSTHLLKIDFVFSSNKVLFNELAYQCIEKVKFIFLILNFQSVILHDIILMNEVYIF